MRCARHAGLILIAAATTMLTAPIAAHATEPEAKALAEALFQDGRTLLDDGRVHEACAKFAMSQRIEPKLGTLLNLATCHEQIGKTATAWAEFTESITQASRANQPAREQFAREHADRLFPLLSRIRLTAQRADLASPFSVLIDDVAIDRGVLDTAFPVDPGEHLLAVRAPRKKTWTQKIIVKEGVGLLSLSIPLLETDESEGTGDGSTLNSADAKPPPTRRADEGLSTPMLVAFGAGAVGVGVGSYFGLRAFSKESDARGECTGSSCSQRGIDLHEDAERSAHVSTVAFGVALVAIGVGVYFLVRPSSSTRPGGRSIGSGARLAW